MPRKSNRPNQHLPGRAERTCISGPKPFAIKSSAIVGVTLLENQEFQWLLFQFSEKPKDEISELLRGAGYRWRPSDRVWFHPIEQESGWKTRLDAERLFDTVIELMSRNPGILQTR